MVEVRKRAERGIESGTTPTILLAGFLQKRSETIVSGSRPWLPRYLELLRSEEHGLPRLRYRKNKYSREETQEEEGERNKYISLVECVMRQMNITSTLF